MRKDILFYSKGYITFLKNNFPFAKAGGKYDKYYSLKNILDYGKK